MSILTIISHTEHYKMADGTIVGLGSTVTEINHLVTVFDEIRHVAMLHSVDAPHSSMPYTSEKIRFIPIKAVGGTSLYDKLNVVWQAPMVINTIRKAVKGSDYFQFRAPTGIGVFVIPYLVFFSKQKGWFKYAGNWKQQNAPIAYRFQKWLLEQQSRPVTINGFWEDRPKHCLPFENPCLTAKEIELGQQTIANKALDFPVELCFVGRLEAAKGVDLIINTIAHLSVEHLAKIKTIHVVGAGALMETYKREVSALSLPFVFHGFLSRVAVHDIYKRSHAILLPSASEGFPKVIAEAMNYGCVPIVSDISSVSHYITNGENGFLMTELSVNGLQVCLLNLIRLNPLSYQQIALNSKEFISVFSYAHYNQRIKKDIL